MPGKKLRNWKVFVITSPRLPQPGRLPSSRCIVMSDKRSAIDFVLHPGRPWKKLSSRVSGAMIPGLLGIFLFCGAPISASAQSGPTVPFGRFATGEAAASNDSYWRRFALGFGASILAHESAHVVSSLLMGFHPHVGLDRGRPTIFSCGRPRTDWESASAIDRNGVYSLNELNRIRDPSNKSR